MSLSDAATHCDAITCGCTHRLLPCFPHATLHLLPEAGATQEQRREAGRCSAVLGAPGLPEHRQEGTGLGHHAFSSRIVLDGAQHADRDRPTWACWGVEGTGPKPGPAAVVTPPWTRRRHGGAPETHAGARWAQRQDASGTGIRVVIARTRYAASKVPAPTSPEHVPHRAVWRPRPHARPSQDESAAGCRLPGRRRYAPAHEGCPRLPAVCWSPLPSSPAGS